MDARQQDRLLFFVNALLNFLGFCSVGLVVAHFGFYLSDQHQLWVLYGLETVVVVFLLQEILRSFTRTSWSNHLKDRWFELSLAIVLFASLLNQSQIDEWFQGFTTWTFTEIFLVYLGVSQTLLFSAHLVRVLRSLRWTQTAALTPARLFVLSFSVPILVGTLLLMLPKASTIEIRFIDALFTATSAICVTGLAVLDTGAHFTPFGQAIIAGLFQLGGLGIVTFTMTFGLLFSGSLGMKERLVVGELLSENRLGQVRGILFKIMGVTLTIELLGAFFLYICEAEDFGLFNLSAFGSALFHSISAFCNAGFSNLPDGLANPAVKGDATYLFVVSFLIILGGIGFPVLLNLYSWLRSRNQSWYKGRVLLLVQTKLVFYTTLGLLVCGTIAILFSESQASFRHLSWLQRLAESSFLSVTSRTAGFNIWPTEDLSVGTSIIVMLLMWVGGSPMSAAGGIKTLTLAIAFLNLKALVLGQEQVEVFGRQISMNTITRSYGIILGSLLILIFGSWILIYLEPDKPVLDLMFEVVSAHSTTGLSRGVTGQLKDMSKLLLVLLMFIGRIGILIFISSLFLPSQKYNHQLLKETIPIN